MDYTQLETTAPVREWQYLTGADFAKMNKEKTVVLVSFSPLEVHGPHLPTVTDNLEAEGILLHTAEKFAQKHPDIEFLHLPPVYVAADLVPKSGSLAFRSSTIEAVLQDMGHSLAKQGFKHVWISNFHGGPRHFVPLERVCRKMSRRYDIQMISLFGLMLRRLTNGSTDIKHVVADLLDVDPERIAGDQHGGVIETSMMLHLLGKYVDPNYTKLDRQTFDKKLEDQGKKPISMDGFLNIVRTFREKLRYWQVETYAGDPALASAETGEKILERLSDLAANALEEVWAGEVPPHEMESPLYPLRHLVLNRAVGWIMEKSVGFRSAVI